MSWPTTADGLWYLFEGQVLIPVDPSTGAAILQLRPQGGIGVGIPPIADGAPGAAAALVEGPIPFTELAAADPTAAGLTVTQVSPGLYEISGQMHRGNDGDDGSMAIDLTTIGGSKAVGKLIKVNAAQDGFDFAFEKVAERHLPGSINSTAAGNPTNTLAIIPIPNKNFDVRIMVTGHTIVTQNGGSNVVVDFMARLADETAGNIIARTPGIGGTERLMFSPAASPGAVDLFDKIPAGSGTVNVYVRTEQQSGANSYTTSNSTTRAQAWAIPV